MPTNTVLATKPMIFSTGRLIPMLAALVSSSRMAMRPIPSLVRRIHHVISACSARISASA
jgi:hypothetical protein